MCVIICGYGHSLPARSEFESASLYNSDGFGFAVLTESGQIISSKGMKSAPVIEGLEAAIKSHASRVVAWVFHARITTHGTTNAANCHPFTVGGDESTYIAHNGILPTDLPKGYTGSDSAYFAETLLPLWGGVAALNYSETWEMLEEWCGTSKIALLSANPAAPLPLVILNEALGTWEGDVWYSNLYHRSPVSRAYAYYDRYEWESAPARELPSVYGVTLQDFETCPYCYGVNEWDTDVCVFCWSCFDCGHDALSACVCPSADSLVEF